MPKHIGREDGARGAYEILRQDLADELRDVDFSWASLDAGRVVAEQTARRRFQSERRRKRRINVCEVLFELLWSELGARVHGSPDPFSMIGWKFREHSIKSAIRASPENSCP